MHFDRYVLSLSAVALLATTGCKDPAADKPAATVHDAKPAAPAPSPMAPAPSPMADATAMTSPADAAAAMEMLPIAPDASSIGFVGSKVTGSHQGSFPQFQGFIALGPDGSIASGKVDVEIDTAALVTDNEKLTGHLKSADFFDVAGFPTASFRSTSIAEGGEGGTHTLTGNLNLHGVEKSISFPATLTVTAGEVTATAEFSINRQDFGVSYAGKPDDLIRDLVVIKLNVKAPRKAVL